MAMKLSMVINTSAFFYQLLFIHNYCRMTITFYGLDLMLSTWMNSFMGLDQGVNSCLSLYHNIVVLSFQLSLEVDYFCFIILEKKLFWFLEIRGLSPYFQKSEKLLSLWTGLTLAQIPVCSYEKIKIVAFCCRFENKDLRKLKRTLLTFLFLDKTRWKLAYHSLIYCLK